MGRHLQRVSRREAISDADNINQVILWQLNMTGNVWSSVVINVNVVREKLHYQFISIGPLGHPPNILSSFTVSGHHPCASHPHSSHSLHNTSHHMRPGDPAQLLASGKQTTRFTIMFLPRSTSCVLTTGVCIFHCLIYRRRIRAVSDDLTGGSPLPLPLPPALTLSPCYEIKYSLLALHLSP